MESVPMTTVRPTVSLLVSHWLARSIALLMPRNCAVCRLMAESHMTTYPTLRSGRAKIVTGQSADAH